MIHCKIRTGVVAFAMLVITHTMIAQPQTSSRQNIKKASDETAASSSHQGDIKVHGHWTIVVRNPDGSVSSRHEFENSFRGTGFVPSLLAGQITQFYWALSIGPICGTQNGAPCYLGESALANDP